jgi:hypothetical protein
MNQKHKTRPGISQRREQIKSAPSKSGAPKPHHRRVYQRYRPKADITRHEASLCLPCLTPAAYALPKYLIFDRIGIANSHIGVILAHATFNLMSEDGFR